MAGGCLPSANIMGTNEPWRKSALRHVLGAPVRARHRGNRRRRRDLLRADIFTRLSSADVRATGGVDGGGGRGGGGNVCERKGLKGKRVLQGTDNGGRES